MFLLTLLLVFRLSFVPIVLSIFCYFPLYFPLYVPSYFPSWFLSFFPSHFPFQFPAFLFSFSVFCNCPLNFASLLFFLVCLRFLPHCPPYSPPYCLLILLFMFLLTLFLVFLLIFHFFPRCPSFLPLCRSFLFFLFPALLRFSSCLDFVRLPYVFCHPLLSLFFRPSVSVFFCPQGFFPSYVLLSLPCVVPSSLPLLSLP